MRRDMIVLDELVERRILDSMRRGELNDLPGAGRPLQLDDDRLVPEELRVAYRVLRNAGYLPPEIELRRDIASAEALVSAATSEEARSAAARRLTLLRLRLGEMRGPGSLAAERDYFDRLLARLEAG
jgi:hypothetical protein